MWRFVSVFAAVHLEVGSWTKWQISTLHVIWKAAEARGFVTLGWIVCRCFFSLQKRSFVFWGKQCSPYNPDRATICLPFIEVRGQPPCKLTSNLPVSVGRFPEMFWFWNTSNTNSTSVIRGLVHSSTCLFVRPLTRASALQLFWRILDVFAGNGPRPYKSTSPPQPPICSYIRHPIMQQCLVPRCSGVTTMNEQRVGFQLFVK